MPRGHGDRGANARPGAWVIEGVVLIAPATDAARTRQVVALYRGLDLAVDLLLVPQGARLSPLDWPDTRRRGVILPEVLADRALVAQVLADFADPGRLVVLHAQGAAQAGALAAAPRGTLRVFDQGGGPAPAPIMPRPDLHLAMDEPARRAIARATGGTCLRLPPPMPPRPRALPVPRPLPGWVGVWDDALVQAWEGFLAAAVTAALRLPAGLLLAGPGAGRVRLPRAIGPVLVVEDPAREPAALQTLGLAVLPLADPTGRSPDIARLLAAEVPILTLDAARAGFEDRWRLPTAADPGALARALGSWAPDLARDGQATGLIAATRATSRSWSHDQGAMTAHVGRCIAAALAAL